MSKKRDRLQVINDILETIRDKGEKTKPTHILYKSNLSHQMMQEYLKELIDKGLVIENSIGRSKTYKLTDKGYEYINEYRLVMRFIDSFGLS